MTKVILFTHQKGGVGKSTLTLNVAYILAETNKVCIIDVDTQGSLIRNTKIIRGIDIVNTDHFDDVLNSDYDYVLIDTPPYIDQYTIELCKVANAIVIPTKIGLFDAQAIDTTVEIVKEAKAESNALIVCNMVVPNTSLTSEVNEVLEGYNIRIAGNKIPNRVAFIRSVLTNGLEHDAKLYAQMKDLTDEIIEIAG